MAHDQEPYCVAVADLFRAIVALAATLSHWLGVNSPQLDISPSSNLPNIVTERTGTIDIASCRRFDWDKVAGQ